MTIPNVINVILSLIFIYLALSLLVSTVQEQLAALWEWRAKHLKSAIFQLLGGDRDAKEILDLLWAHPLIHSLNQESSTKIKRVLQQVFGRKFASVGPSYLDAMIFATALLEVLCDRYAFTFNSYKETIAQILPQLTPAANELAPANPTPALPENLRATLGAIARQTQARFNSQDPSSEPTVQAFAREISRWFEQAMKRSSGVYKRNAAGVAIILSAIVVILGNVDSLCLVDRLYGDPTLSLALGQIAEKSCTNSQDPFQCLQNLDLSTLKSLPLGWTFPSGAIPHLLPQQSPWGVTALGWLLSTIAISRGSPFWFELLNKVINVRNAGSKPQDSNS